MAEWTVASETGALTDVLVCPPDHDRSGGLTVLAPGLSLFAAGGGGPLCLTCPPRREE